MRNKIKKAIGRGGRERIREKRRKGRRRKKKEEEGEKRKKRKGEKEKKRPHLLIEACKTAQNCFPKNELVAWLRGFIYRFLLRPS